MKKILNSEQFGFCPGKQMSTASNSIIATFEYIKESKIEAQFLSVDIERAYDRVLNSVAMQVKLSTNLYFLRETLRQAGQV